MVICVLYLISLISTIALQAQSFALFSLFVSSYQMCFPPPPGTHGCSILVCLKKEMSPWFNINNPGCEAATKKGQCDLPLLTISWMTIRSISIYKTPLHFSVQFRPVVSLWIAFSYVVVNTRWIDT